VVLPVTRPALAALVMALAPATATAADCAVVFADAPRAALADLPTDPGEGLFRCPGFEAPLVHWTIEVDPDRRSLGLRDRPLIGPDRRAAFRLELDQPVADYRAVIFGPAAPGPTPLLANRRIATLCDFDDPGGDAALSCALGAARVRIRLDARDRDADGRLDAHHHAVSFWDGASRLHVLAFTTPYAEDPRETAAVWVALAQALALP